jgi:hypothetical protein
LEATAECPFQLGYLILPLKKILDPLFDMTRDIVVVAVSSASLILER